MTRPAFPADIRAAGTRVLRDGYAYSPPANVDVSNPGSSEKRRPKSTAAWEERTVPFNLPWAEWLLFEVWVRETLVDGTLWFDWQPPEAAVLRPSKFVINDGRAYPPAVPAPGGRMRVTVTIASLRASVS